jgi:GNAT superfamily N-acetyltransferase
MWLPPGAVELTPEVQGTLPATIERLAGAYAGRVTATCDALEEHHPEQPHWYLSMLGTRSDERGRGQGMALLRYCLGVLDAAGQPTYLESSNPANNKRYAGAGFQPRQVFTIGADGPEVTTFWRPAGG